MKDSRMRKYYDAMFLLVLKDYILLNSNSRGRITSGDWIGKMHSWNIFLIIIYWILELFGFLKKIYEERVLEALVLKCFMLVIKWGPSSGLPSSSLREQYEFFTKLCLGISKNSPSNQQEDILDIAFDFCRHVSSLLFGDLIMFRKSVKFKKICNFVNICVAVHCCRHVSPSIITLKVSPPLYMPQ